MPDGFAARGPRWPEPSEQFAFTTERLAGATLVKLDGELDLGVVDSLKAELWRIEAGGPGRLFLDLRELTFIDSSGLRLVMNTEARSRRGGFDFAVVADGELSQLLETTGISRAVTVLDVPPAL